MDAIFTKDDIELFGFVYEPEVTKCKSLKLKLYVPESIDALYKTEVAHQIPYKYVNNVVLTPNAYKNNPNFLADIRVIVIGHN